MIQMIAYRQVLGVIINASDQRLDLIWGILSPFFLSFPSLLLFLSAFVHSGYTSKIAGILPFSAWERLRRVGASNRPITRWHAQDLLLEDIRVRRTTAAL